MDRSNESLEYYAENHELDGLLKDYILFCKTAEAEYDDSKSRSAKRRVLFPNVAGFCRYLGVGSDEYEELEQSYPEEFSRVRTVLEDEALNSEISPTVLSAYLKKRLGYDKSEKNEGTDGQLRVVFDKELLEDGE